MLGLGVPVTLVRFQPTQKNIRETRHNIMFLVFVQSTFAFFTPLIFGFVKKNALFRLQSLITLNAVPWEAFYFLFYLSLSFFFLFLGGRGLSLVSILRTNGRTNHGLAREGQFLKIQATRWSKMALEIDLL